MQKKSVKMKSPLSSSAKEAVAALRAELQMELQNIKQCGYQPYECTQLTLDGYNYCMRHILEDKNAPFRQCSYIYTLNGKRCYMPAPKGDKKDHVYCSEHSLKNALQKNRHGSRYPPPCTAEALLNSLTHYVKRPRSRTVSSSTQHSDEGRSTTPDEAGELKATRSLDPFVDIDASSLYNAKCNSVLDMCSESESDVEPSTYANVWQDAQADSSDNESIDSEQEDVLKHASVYTAEEITSVTRDKLIRLQSLYIDQYKHLYHLLREKRRKYLHALKREKETCCSIAHQIRDHPKEQRLYKKLKAYNQYHKKHGVEAILNKRVHDLRLKVTEGVVAKPPTYSKCAFSEGGVKCGERSLPLARHCRKHILEDTNQVLFRQCGKMCGDVECTTPVEAIFLDTTCRLHMDIPPIRSYSQARKDSESDYDESLDPTTSNQSHQNPNVIPQIPDFEWQSTDNPSGIMENDRMFVKSDPDAYSLDFGNLDENSALATNADSETEIKLDGVLTDTDDLKNDEIAEQLREMEDDCGGLGNVERSMNNAEGERYEHDVYEENEEESELQVS